MKITFLILASGLLISPLHAGNQPKRGKHVESERTKIRKQLQAAREKAFKEAEDYLKARDLNGDGSLSLEEFSFDAKDKSAAQSEFTEANKNGDRCLTTSEVCSMLGLRDKAEEQARAQTEKKK